MTICFSFAFFCLMKVLSHPGYGNSKTLAYDKAYNLHLICAYS